MRIALLLTVSILFNSSSAAAAQECYSYDTSVSLSGTLVRIDEGGYFDYVVLQPDHPLCTIANPKDSFSAALSDLTQLQLFSPEDEKNDAISKRIDRLVGARVTLKGKIYQAVSGYYRTDAAIFVDAINAQDAKGEALLKQPSPAPAPIKDVAVYDVRVHAGKRLIIDAWDRVTHETLKPVKDYVPTWVTGGWVAYLHCKKGYAMEASNRMQSNRVLCETDGIGCGVDVFQSPPVNFRFRCRKCQNPDCAE
jgi:hypothetical protein